MITAPPSPALKPERRGAFAAAAVPADRAQDRPLRLADALAAGGAMQRCQSDKFLLSSAVTVEPIGVTTIEAPGAAGGGAGGSQT
jgi:hypothetical protein